MIFILEFLLAFFPQKFLVTQWYGNIKSYFCR